MNHDRHQSSQKRVLRPLLSTAAPSSASSSSTSLKRTGKHVAIKTAHRNRLTTQFLDTYLRTAELELSLAPHVNILQLLGVAWSIDAARISSVFELCTGGSLGERSARPRYDGVLRSRYVLRPAWRMASPSSIHGSRL